MYCIYLHVSFLLKNNCLPKNLHLNISAIHVLKELNFKNNNFKIVWTHKEDLKNHDYAAYHIASSYDETPSTDMYMNNNLLLFMLNMQHFFRTFLLLMVIIVGSANTICSQMSYQQYLLQYSSKSRDTTYDLYFE